MNWLLATQHLDLSTFMFLYTHVALRHARSAGRIIRDTDGHAATRLPTRGTLHMRMTKRPFRQPRDAT
ncbi:MAG: hypothetical protein F9K31_12540 [Dokdonella sp.]|jgi:hypothetical protein|nr:MAG: hypothetical protein F9K31_12540 [Dokdonella sp.]